MLIGVGELVVFAIFLALLVLGGWYVWTALRPGGEAGRLPPRERAELAMAIERARWVPGHDETDGVTRVLVRRSYTGLDGRPVVLEERVLETFPANDPAWEGLFTEAMSKARFRCQYLNAEELP
ncbi:MAG: hypothetical protein ACXVX8_15570 [Blastococcus sp.]